MENEYKVVINDYGWTDPPQSFCSFKKAWKYVEKVLKKSQYALYRIFLNGKIIKSNYPRR